MDDFKGKIFAIFGFFTNRIFILSVILILIFVGLVVTLFDRQIVNGHRAVARTITSQRNIYTGAPRGEIFDRHGRPLAVNTPVFTVSLDSTVAQPNANESFLFFMDIMERHGEEIRVESEFLITAARPRQFTGSVAAQRRWMADLGVNADLIEEGLTANDAYELLLEIFEIPPHLSSEDAHTLLLMRTALHLQWINLNQIPLAVDIDRRTVAAIEEHNHRIPGIFVGFEYLRHYPMGKYTTNIVGYINRITQDELDAHQGLGYQSTDLFGRTGIEQAFELSLRGRRGVTTVEVDSSFRRLNVLETTLPVPGDDIFLTIDAVLQRNIYYAIEDTLSTVLINRLRRQPVAFSREIIDSMTRANNISSMAIMAADDEFPASLIVGNFVRDNFGESLEDATRQYINDFIGENVINGRINIMTMLDVMEEQGIITITPEERTMLDNRRLSVPDFITARIRAREITPHLVNIEPATASVVVTCVETGGILAAVNYPTFDANNFLPHSFDSEYVWQTNNDPTRPQFNRAFSEARAPGSSFKMVAAIAGLGEGIITPTDRIFDRVAFTDAGHPPLHCMSRSGHGSVNVAQAIAVSCNYFFCRVTFEMGNHRNGRTLEGISTFNYYMMAFGFGQPTGVEITERAMATENGVPRIPSPAYAQHLRQSDWFDGNTIQASIGQGDANFTAASMVKYFATLATGGERYQLHLLDRIAASDGSIHYFEPVVEYTLEIDPNNLAAVHQGMLNVSRPGGTGAVVFSGFPMQVGVKSGTAETHLGVSHSTYGGFAPFENPQIAAYAAIPFGDALELRSSAGHLLRAVLEEYFGIDREIYTSSNNDLVR